MLGGEKKIASYEFKFSEEKDIEDDDDCDDDKVINNDN